MPPSKVAKINIEGLAQKMRLEEESIRSAYHNPDAGADAVIAKRAKKLDEAEHQRLYWELNDSTLRRAVLRRMGELFYTKKEETSAPNPS